MRKKRETHTPAASKWSYSINMLHTFNLFYLTFVKTTSMFLKMLELSFKITQPLLEKQILSEWG